jgi:membrane protease YdiL (CAAX protease family)
MKVCPSVVHASSPISRSIRTLIPSWHFAESTPMQNHHPMTSVPSIPLGGLARGVWTAGGAIGFVVLVMGSTMLATTVAQLAYGAWLDTLDPIDASDFPTANGPLVVMSLQLAAQLLQLAMIWWLAGLWHSDRRAALGIVPVRLDLSDWAGFIVLLLVVKTVATMIAAGLAPSAAEPETAPYLKLAVMPGVWLLFLVVVTLAGLTEELLFRGVLSRTLETTRLGFWIGAGLASAAFAAMHLQYGVRGQIVIFAVGMTLAWIRARSGSLWPAVVCHAVNNVLALAAMRMLA